MPDDLPRRFHEDERKRRVDQRISRPATPGPHGTSGDADIVDDDEGQVRIITGLLSDGSYGQEIYDSAGVLKHRLAWF